METVYLGPGPEGSPSLHSYYQSLEKEIRDFLKGEDDNYIADVNNEKLEDYIYEKYSLPELIIDGERKPVIRKKNILIEARGVAGTKFEEEVSGVEITMFLKDGNNLDKSLIFESGTYTLRTLEVNFDPSESSITFEVPSRELTKEIEHIKEVFDRRNPEIVTHNSELKNLIKSLVQERKSKVTQLEDDFGKAIKEVNIPLIRVDVSEAPIVDLKVRKPIQDLKKPIVQPQEAFKLDKKYVLDILDIIKNSGLQFELSPKVFGSKLKEEDLRDIILSHLNVIFEGSATGESFSKLGKTDIYLRIAKGQIFIAECKFWGGEKAYLDSLNQLFKYLTWRRNYGLIITFVKNKGFSEKIHTVEEAIKKHPTHRRELEKIDESHLQSIHTFPDDDKKAVEIHHVLFNLYVS